MAEPNPTILIADDETHIVYILQAKLADAGFEVVVARDGREALDLARRHRPRLLVTDLDMPRMDGMTLCLALREHPETADLPVIMLTGRGHTVPDGDRARTNIRHLESKPFSARHLLDLVRQHLGDAPAAA
ncbi:MAG: response regulator [Planctomycetota bacterium]